MGAAARAQVRVLLVENHQLVADALAALINDQHDLAVVGVTASVAESKEQAEAWEPDVVVVDYHLGDGSGADAALAIRAAHPNARLIFLSHDDGVSAQFAALQAGASAFIHKSNGSANVLDAIRAVAQGQALMTPQSVATLIGAHQKMDGERTSLSEREIQVLRLMAAGMSSRDIAAALVIGYTTVRSHIRSIGHKLGVHSKVEAVVKARELQLFE